MSEVRVISLNPIPQFNSGALIFKDFIIRVNVESHWVTGALSPRVNQPEHEADRSSCQVQK